MVSIKRKILIVATSLVIGSIMIISICSFYAVRNSTLFVLENSMEEIANTTSILFNDRVNDYKELAIELTLDSVLTQDIPIASEDTMMERTEVVRTVLERKNVLEKKYDIEISVINENGIILRNGVDVSQREYFVKAKVDDSAYITTPLESLSN